MTRLMVWSVVAALAAGCSATKGGSSTMAPSAGPAAGVVSSQDVLSTLTTPNPVWTGTTTASDGVSGAATVTFGTSGTVSWTGPTGTYTGTFSATNPGNGVHVVATIQGSGAASACNYAVVGDVVGGVLTGTYTLGGPCIDKSGHGTFRLVQGAVLVSCGPFSYGGPHVIQLSNSGDATELAWVKANVTNGGDLSGPTTTTLNGPTTWTSDGNYPVVLVKGAGQDFGVYVNVTTGQVLTTPSTNSHGDLQAISHVARFVCASVAQ